MTERLAGVAAAVVGAALAAVALAEYVAPGFPPPPGDPLATGVLLVAAGTALVGAGGLAVRSSIDHLALRIGTGLALAALSLAVLRPAALRFGGVLWLGLVVAALVGAAAYRTVSHARRAAG